MNIKPEELEANGYYLKDKLEHDQLVPFIREYLKKKTFFSIAYLAANLLAMVLIGFLFYFRIINHEISFGNGLSFLSYGIALSFLLIPLHEYIHVLAYKSQGAKNTSYAVDLKRFVFMALANQYVANKREFIIIALAPFIVISFIFCILFFIVGLHWQFTILGVLLTHTAFCSGDFGLLSYFQFYKTSELVTYDDVDSKISYFFEKKQETT